MWSLAPVKCWSRLPYALRRDDPEVEAKAVVGDDGRLRRAVRRHLGDARMRHEMSGERRRIRGGCDQVDVARRLGTAAGAPGLGDPIARRMLRELGDDLAKDGQHAAEQHASGVDLRPRVGAGESGEHALLGLRPEARKLAEPLRFGGRPEVVHRLDVELLPEATGRLRAEAGHVHDLDEPRWDLVAELRERTEVACLHELDDLRLDRAADAGDLRGRSVDREARDGRSRLADARGRPPVGRQTEGVGTVQLEHVREELEPLGELRVARQPLPRGGFGLLRHPGDDMPRAPRHLHADVQRAREPRADRPGARRASSRNTISTAPFS